MKLKRTLLLLFLLMLLIFIPCERSQSQTVTITRSQAPRLSTAATEAASPAVPTTPTPTTSTTGESETPKKTLAAKRVEALLKAKLDRTLPAVLKAWSQPKKDTAVASPVKKRDYEQASVANIFDGLAVFNMEKKSELTAGDLVEVFSDKKLQQTVGMLKVLEVSETKLTGKFTQKPKPNSKPAGQKESAGDKQAKKEKDAGDAEPDAVKSTGGLFKIVVKKRDGPKQAPANQATKPKQIVAGWQDLKPKMVVRLAKPVDSKKTDQAAQDALVKQEVKDFTRNVTVGDWDAIKDYLKKLEAGDADKVYAHLLKSLAKIPSNADGRSSGRQRRGAKPPVNFLSPEDILAIADAAPAAYITSIAGLKKATGSGGDPISGRWEGKATAEEIPIDIDLTVNFQLSKNGLSGDMTLSAQGEQRGPFPIESGSFDRASNLVTFSVSLSPTEEDLAAVSLQLDGTEMSGEITSEDDISAITISLELVEPAPNPDLVEVGGAADASDDDTSADSTAAGLPAGVRLPEGMSIDDLPPGALEAIQARAGTASQTPQTTPSTSKSKKSHVPALARLIANSVNAGFDFTKFTETIKQGTTHFGGKDPVKKVIAAELFLKANMLDEAISFLPPIESAIDNNQIIPLKMWSQAALKKYSSKRAPQWLEKAWQVNQALVSVQGISKSDKDTAMVNLIELSPQIDRELGEKWLSESFTDSPERGMVVLTNLGTKSSKLASQPVSNAEDARLKILRLQNGAVENLLKVSPELADQWSNALTLLADTWLIEAETTVKYTKTKSRGYRRYDRYGNSYWADEPYYGYRRNETPRPIKVGDMLEIAPSAQWQKRIEPTMKIRMQKLFASLHMRINEEDLAFPYIEKIAATNPKIARELVSEFLRIWTRNHDPNNDRRERDPYVYFYGFDQKAEAIPLTRSKQERNLEELQGWVNRIRAMNLEDLDENLLSNAFTTCHSSAEVYDLKRVKSVFGDLKNLKPETIASLCQKMRRNLSSNWRNIRNQEQKQTKRRAPEVRQEVVRGYGVAKTLTQEALQASPDNWQLHLSLACLIFEENAYRQTFEKSSSFTAERDRAFEQFAIAADKYKKLVVTLDEDKQTTSVYDTWFYASLGACDLGQIRVETLPDPKQYPKVKAAIAELPGTLGDSHMAKFANNLFTRMNPVKPELKFRYLRAGFKIVGDHPRAWEARNLYDYYNDLVSELKLQTVIDGSPTVGHGQPFGVYVNLLHTKEIERESGGFGKYAQNQNAGAYSYNYGRPTENYRDKFTKSVKLALKEHFEVQSVTFQSAEGMKSLPAKEAGWRVTPYAYILLKPRGSEVDRIAPLKLDMDFMDTSGYAVLPIESPELVIDATRPKGDLRPVQELKVTQTLDERQADEGRLIVEVSATAKGLVPDLEDMINVQRDRFEVVSVDDQGVLPSEFEKDSNRIQILSERSWTIEYRAKESQTKNVSFSFGDAKSSDTELKFQRYEDADLVDVSQEILLERSYRRSSVTFLYWLLPMVALILAILAGAMYWGANRPTETIEKFQMPSEINPFTVLALLQDIRQRNGISNSQSAELESSIVQIERQYFGSQTSDANTDLKQLASTWLNRSN